MDGGCSGVDIDSSVDLNAVFLSNQKCSDLPHFHS